ncbi:MAG TPA: histidine phosphatase family protein [Anaerolineales bacterium]|nr:histidine phosphatase family protein [Anaerolineales bacterium]
MNKYLILVKHSLPEVVESLPAREWRLAAEGRLRAQRLAECLRPFQPEVIVSSIEPKAKETAEIIANTYHVEFQIADGLHEHDRSKAPYLSQDKFQEILQEFFRKPDKLVFGLETADEAYTRFSRAVHTLLDEHTNKTILIVAHGTVISLLVSRLTGISDLLLWRELGLPSYVVLDLQKRMLITKVNSV